MKRLTALVLAVLLLAAVPAWAEDLTLEEKFVRQVQESAFRGTVTFAVTGDHTAAVKDETWAALKTIAPRIAIDMDHSYVRAQNGGQATLSLLLDGENAGKTTLLYHNTLMGLKSEILTDQPTWYTASRTWDAGQLLQSALQGDRAWPPIWRMLLAALSAPQEWKDRAAAYLTPYETKLGVWMSGYVQMASVVPEETELRCVIPAQALKAEIKQLLVDFYADQSLLSLLREVATSQEAAAFLQPSMMSVFFSLLDQLELDGDIEILRRFDQQGNSLLDRMVLPFSDTQALSKLIISVSPDMFGQKWNLMGQTRQGVDFDITCVGGTEAIYTGSVALLLPAEEEDGASFVVEDGAPERRSVAFDYNFSWDPGEETYILAADRFERTMKGTLLIKPQNSAALPNQTLELEIHLSSGSSQRSATRLEGTLSWRDMDTDASISAVLSSRTAAPFEIETLNGVAGAMRVDLMNSSAYTALTQGWMEHAKTWLDGVLAHLLPSGAR